MNHTSNPSLHSLPTEVVDYIFSLLSLRDLHSTKAVNQDSAKATDRQWKRLMKEEHLDFGWSICQNDKSNYYLNRALLYYQNIQFTEEFSKRVKNLYPLMESFPYFKAYHEEDLAEVEKREAIDTKEIEREIAEKAKEWGGEALLHALFKARKFREDDSFDQYLQYFENAMRLNASIASYFAVDRLFHYYRCDERDVVDKFFSLAKQAADQGDYRGLQCLVERTLPAYVQELYTQKYIYPPIFYGLAKGQVPHLTPLPSDKRLKNLPFQKSYQLNLEEAEKLMDQAIAMYEPRIPLQVLMDAALIQQNLKNFSKAERLYERILLDYKHVVTCDILHTMMNFYEFHLEKSEKVIEIYKWAIQQEITIMDFMVPTIDSAYRRIYGPTYKVRVIAKRTIWS